MRNSDDNEGQTRQWRSSKESYMTSKNLFISGQCADIGCSFEDVSEAMKDRLIGFCAISTFVDNLTPN